jgi:hypothetical protein
MDWNSDMPFYELALVGGVLVIVAFVLATQRYLDNYRHKKKHGE